MSHIGVLTRIISKLVGQKVAIRENLYYETVKGNLDFALDDLINLRCAQVIAGGPQPVYLPFAAGTGLPITISSFQSTYSAYGRFPRLRAAQITGGQISTGALTGGAGYNNGSYPNTPLTGGTGFGATANITIAGGIVTALTIVLQGFGYQSSDTLSASGLGSGTGFAYTVSTTTNQQFVYLSGETVITTENTYGLPSAVSIDVDNAGGVLGDNIYLIISV